MKKLVPLFAIFVPILAMAGWIGYHYTMKGSPSVELEITGYDPRDLLSGHYLEYRVQYGEKGECKRVAQQAPNLCMCFDKNVPAKASWLGVCTYLPQDCHLFIKGQCKSGQFKAGIERFYFPERYTKDLSIVPDRARIKVRMAEGRAQVFDLLIDGLPWRKALEKAKTDGASNSN